MPHPDQDLHLRLGLLDDRPGAVTATITGTSTPIARALLSLHGFEPLDEATMVMARIDREEPHYAELTAHALRAEGVRVDITPQLHEEIDTEWTWAAKRARQHSGGSPVTETGDPPNTCSSTATS
ncbi:hypothetical protein QNN03_04605 [Streptomyces sp. GXMU-J15]|uniref:Uncharacterized protein n=1 Tax=Streptomyces fuscus TaxID=3048495 RepID=A0ABT7ISZ9_9ACTN|nr:hypothetical protein [Streptomyces fuscus]MDL2075713.1 hypothetical protein [Streptomyces fuscus]